MSGPSLKAKIVNFRLVSCDVVKIVVNVFGAFY